jgi:hypothetical protein
MPKKFRHIDQCFYLSHELNVIEPGIPILQKHQTIDTIFIVTILHNKCL